MKILIVHYRYYISGGPERYLFNVKAALEARGHEVIPFSIRISRNREDRYSDYFVENIGGSDEVFVDKYPKTFRTYSDLVGREFYSWKVKRRLKRLIRDTRPDVCYLLVYKRALSPSVIDACHEMGVPIVNRISDYNTVCGAASLYRAGGFCDECLGGSDFPCLKHRCVKGSRVYSLMRYLSMKLFTIRKYDQKIQAYVCTNGYMKEMMVRKGYDSRKLCVVPTFFKENEEYSLLPKPNEPKGVVRFLFIGNMDESKGIYDLIEALVKIKDKSRLHLDIVGGLHESEKRKVEALVADNGLGDYVSIYPFRSDGKVYSYYLENHVTVLPARWVENLPNTLIESLYFHRPVLVPEWGSFRYTTDSSVAFRYTPLSVDSLSQIIEHIIEHPAQVTSKAGHCADFFAANYREADHLMRLEGIFDKLVKHENI